MATPFDYDITYEQLLALKLNNTDDTFNKRPGDIIYTAYAENSIEIIKMLATLQIFRDTTFADTAPREELILIAAERGLTPYPATNAILRAEFNIDVPIGSRYSLEDVNYVVLERISLGNFRVEAEQSGAIGNAYLGQLIPVEDIPGLTSAQLVELLIPGEDEEDTEALRKRYRDSFDAVAFGGNRADYKQKVSALPGVGGVRVYRNQYGPNTVGLTICDSQFKQPTPTLVNEVQEAVDPTSSSGDGDGIAPINHLVTVTGAQEVAINISSDFELASGYSWSTVEPAVIAILEDYLESLNEEWAQAVTKAQDEVGLVVRISQIEARLLDVQGIIDIANTSINGNAANLQLTKTQLAKVGTVTPL